MLVGDASYVGWLLVTSFPPLVTMCRRLHGTGDVPIGFGDGSTLWWLVRSFLADLVAHSKVAHR
jgi:hypothetical protein